MKTLEPNWQELDIRDSEYIRNLHPIFDTELDTYKNVSAPPYVTGHISLWDVLQKIKYNLIYDISPQMYLTNKYVDNILNPVYDELKEIQPAICYNASFIGYKNLKNTKTIHNLMFLDIDNFSSKEEALAYKAEIISKYDWILACSLSLSKIGLHVIVMVDKIRDSNDFNRKYDYISKTYFNAGLDNDSKSLSRFTIIPYDHDIYISDNPIVLPIESIIQNSMSGTYIPSQHASSNALSLSESKSMRCSYIKSLSQKDNEKSMSCSMGGEGICTTHTFSELQKLNEFLNTSARQNGLVFKSFANEDLIEDPDKPLFDFNGFPYVEINLFIYGKKSVPEGHRTSFLGAILAQMMYLNVMLPHNPNPDIRRNLLGFMKSVNRKYCNPSLPDNELLRSYNSHWKRYNDGSLDVSKYIKSKRSLWSVDCSLTSNQKKSETMTRINKIKRVKNLEILQEVIQQMASNGEKVTQELVAEQVANLGLKGLKISTIKSLWKYFKPSIQAYKKGTSTDIIISEEESKSRGSMAKTNQKSIDIDVDDDGMDLGKHIIETHKNILAKQDRGSSTGNGFSLTEEQQQSIFNRVYSRFLPFINDEDRKRLHSRFRTKLQDYDCDERKILCMKPESITDGDIYAKHFSLESQLQSLCYDLSKESEVNCPQPY